MLFDTRPLPHLPRPITISHTAFFHWDTKAYRSFDRSSARSVTPLRSALRRRMRTALLLFQQDSTPRADHGYALVFEWTLRRAVRCLRPTRRTPDPVFADLTNDGLDHQKPSRSMHAYWCFTHADQYGRKHEADFCTCWTLIFKHARSLTRGSEGTQAKQRKLQTKHNYSCPSCQPL